MNLLLMIDGLKMDFNDKKCAEKLLNNLEFEIRVSSLTGEIRRYQTNYHNLFLSLYPSNRIMIEGSVHKFYNSFFGANSQNYDQFNISKLKYAIEALTYLTEVKASKIAIRNLEFGHNIKLDKSAKQLMKNFVVYDYRKAFDVSTFNGKGYGIEYAGSQAGIKIYDKGAMYGLIEDVIRIEKKIWAMQNQFKHSISLEDLLSKSIWNDCQIGLIEMFRKCLFVDVKSNRLNKKELTFMNKFQNPKFWEELTYAQRYHYSKEVLPKVNDKLDLWRIKTDLINQMEISYELLVNS